MAGTAISDILNRMLAVSPNTGSSYRSRKIGKLVISRFYSPVVKYSYDEKTCPKYKQRDQDTDWCFSEPCSELKVVLRG